MKKKHVSILFLLVIIVMSGIWWVRHEKAAAPGGTSRTTTRQSNFDKKQYSLTDPSSPWAVVNKHRPLTPKTYTPTDLVIPDIPLRSNITAEEKQLRKITATALRAMDDAAKKDGVSFTLQSGYRSYTLQDTLYNRYVTQQGQAAADTQSARPGYSEHQTGLALDLGSAEHPECDVEACFGQTPEGTWLVEHAHDYGFIIRYTTGNENTTGYIAEPWHLRYVGRDLALEMKRQNIPTMEQFFGTGNAPSY